MLTREDVLAELRHVRLIHFSLVLVCSTALYLVLAAHSDAHLVQRDISAFKDGFLDKSAALSAIAEEHRETREERARTLLKDLAPSLGFDVPLAWATAVEVAAQFERITCEGVPPLRATMTLGSMHHALESATWKREVVHRIGIAQDDQEQVTKVKQLLAMESFSRVLHGGSKTEGIPVVMSRDDARVTGLDVTNWSAPSDAQFRGGIVYTRPGMSGFVDTTLEETLPVVFSIERSEASLPASWFDRAYPYLSRHWDDFSGKTVEGALEHARIARTDSLTERRTDVFGIDLGGRDFGWLVVAVILAQQSYLVLYLWHLIGAMAKAEGKDGTSVGVVSPWMGTMNGRLAWWMSFATVIALPIIALYATIQTLVPLSADWTNTTSATAAGVALVLGLFALAACSRLRDRAMPTASSG